MRPRSADLTSPEMKRSIFYSGEEHRDATKSIRCDHEMILHPRVGVADLALSSAPVAELGPSLSDDTEIRGYNMPSIPHCTEGSPADDSLCSPVMQSAFCATFHSPAPESSKSPVCPPDKPSDEHVPQRRVYLQPSLAAASTRELPAPKRKVSFAPGPLEDEYSGDGHPVSSQV